MKYQQPYGISDPNAPYINGNPSTGTMGSIPPAWSIEHPQREIHNFIDKSALVPVESDLYQLSKAVQSGLVNWGVDIGEVNKIAITPVVPIGTYHVGQRFLIRVSFGNTSQVTLNVNGLGPKPLVHTDRTPISGLELTAGQLIDVAYDDSSGGRFQMLGGGVAGGVVTMTNHNHFYVSVNIGSDTLYDGTSPVIAGTMGGPFKTIEKALATMTKYNLGGWNFYIHVADGVYAQPIWTQFPRPNGSGTVVMLGNSTNPSAVQIFNTSAGSCWRIQNGGSWHIEGFYYRATAPYPGDGGGGILVQNDTFIGLGTSSWGPTAPGGFHYSHSLSSSSLVFGIHTILGGGGGHQQAFANGVLYNNTAGPGTEPNLVIPTPVAFPSGFVSCGEGGQLRPLFETMTGGGIAGCTGPRYVASTNGVVHSAGRGESYLPGNAAGIKQFGGQYI